MNLKVLKYYQLIIRVCSLLMSAFFVVFFIGEGFSNNLSFNEIALLICIPVLLLMGVIIALKKDLIGGIIISSSVILFNILEYIFYEKISSVFIFCLILGINFIIIGILKNKLKVKK